MDRDELIRDYHATAARTIAPMVELAAADLGLTSDDDRMAIEVALADAFAAGFNEGQVVANAQVIEAGVDVQTQLVNVEPKTGE